MSKLDYSKITPEQRLAIDEVMDEFDFEKVERHMKTVNWGWSAPTPEDEWNLEIPDISQLKAACRRLLVNAFTSVTMNKEEGHDYDGPCYSSKGSDVPYEEVLRDLKARDEQDMNRKVDPLRPTPDAVIVDSTHLSFDEVVETILGIVKEKYHE